VTLLFRIPSWAAFEQALRDAVGDDGFVAVGRRAEDL